MSEKIKNVIAIDGPAASGKSTIAQLVAEKMKAYYISTGNMYRAIAYKILENNIKAESAEEETFEKVLSNIKLDFKKDSDDNLIMILNGKPLGQEIRKPEVANIVSYVAKSPAVRKWLLDKQRSLTHLGLIVIEGRDIGTVVFPDAKFKFFLTASPTVRAKRRLKQDGENASDATVETVSKAIAQRDKIDSNRKIAPLKQADDAVLVDSSNMNKNEVVEYIVSKINT
ncbi:MAG: (d)CMP kinase [Victivallales bacterium]|nr:(d)CMP kinase [Victivallales bacterium]